MLYSAALVHLLLLLLPSPLCQSSTIGHFSSGLLLKEWGWAKLASEVGRVASWLTVPCPGRALAVADCTVLLSPRSPPSPGASDGFWCYEGTLGRAVGERSASWYPSSGAKVCVTHGWETWADIDVCPWLHIAGALIGERQRSRNLIGCCGYQCASL